MYYTMYVDHRYLEGWQPLLTFLMGGSSGLVGLSSSAELAHMFAFTRKVVWCWHAGWFQVTRLKSLVVLARSGRGNFATCPSSSSRLAQAFSNGRLARAYSNDGRFQEKPEREKPQGYKPF